MRTFRHASAAPSDAFKSYLRRVFLEHPWFDPELAPLVMEKQGEVVGFIGRMHRPMQFAGRPIRAAVAAQLMVDPQRKLGFAALELVRALQSGPQDFTFSDGANEQALRIWERCGGVASRLLSFEWTHRLRPLQTITQNLQAHPRAQRLARLAHPAAGIADVISTAIAPWLCRKPRSRLTREDANAQQIVPLWGHQDAALRPVYTVDSYQWLLQRTAEATEYGPLRTRLVRDQSGSAIGWFVYFVRPRQTAHALQIGATYGNGRAVLAELFRDAWEQHAANVTGALDPLLLTDLSNSHCQFRCASLGVLLHSRHPELLATIERGDAILSRLEGEWWLRFGIDRHVEW